MNDEVNPQGQPKGAARSAETARSLIRKAKRATRRRFRSEDKIRILMEGIRGEVAVSELCRREGIHPTVYYKWLKDFMEAGKARMRGDALRALLSTVTERHFPEYFGDKKTSGARSLAHVSGGTSRTTGER
jgi:transposase